MNFPMRVHENLLVILAASLLLLVNLSAAPKPRLREPVGGLQMTVYPDQAESKKSKVQEFRVELSNTGGHDLILNLGFMLANGSRQYPANVILTLTDAEGKSRRLELLGPGMINGRVDPLVVPLPEGSSFSIPVDLDKYWAASSREFDYKLKPGTYLLEAEFTGKGVSQQEANLDVKGIALMPYWTGTITSNQVRFDAPRQ